MGSAVSITVGKPKERVIAQIHKQGQLRYLGIEVRISCCQATETVGDGCEETYVEKARLQGKDSANTRSPRGVEAQTRASSPPFL